MTSKEVTRILRSKTIERVELNQSIGEHANGGGLMQHVAIYLSDGTRLSFHTQEHPDAADYGTTMIISRPGHEALFTDRPGGTYAKKGKRP